ncbi:cytochrome c [Noviherbaspirillum saxi]|uniref:Cytochrome c n=1 Tax=Noviherbaspirillum saxi TaxID=2320863 RepID=A0A3A3FS79_9BURK|nr:cytochrome c [Noviherbaspirillum saxi]
MLYGLLLILSVAGCGQDEAVSAALGDAERGKEAVARYGCIACHAIPGALNQGSNVGPPLHKIAQRAYLGGVIPNTPEQMVRWLRNPAAIDPRSAMPNLGLSEAEAKDIAAYLYTLK